MANNDSTVPIGRAQDLTGRRFGKLTVLHRVHNGKGKKPLWACACDCGNTCVVWAKGLRAGTKSCGCIARQRASDQLRKHGRSGTPEFVTWSSMLNRCYNKNAHNYSRYGNRGILACEGIRLSFMKFLETIGDRPTDKHSLDRIDNDAGYTCGRCRHCLENGFECNIRWATAAQQARNTNKNVLLEFNGIVKTLSEWCEMYHVNHTTIAYRLRHGMDIKAALETPVRKWIRKKH